jgi:hypothetical protein
MIWEKEIKTIELFLFYFHELQNLDLFLLCEWKYFGLLECELIRNNKNFP